jgi:hypothetical protein
MGAERVLWLEDHYQATTSSDPSLRVVDLALYCHNQANLHHPIHLRPNDLLLGYPQQPLSSIGRVPLSGRPSFSHPPFEPKLGMLRIRVGDRRSGAALRRSVFDGYYRPCGARGRTRRECALFLMCRIDHY